MDKTNCEQVHTFCNNSAEWYFCWNVTFCIIFCYDFISHVQHQFDHFYTINYFFISILIRFPFTVASPSLICVHISDGEAIVPSDQNVQIYTDIFTLYNIIEYFNNHIYDLFSIFSHLPLAWSVLLYCEYLMLLI